MQKKRCGLRNAVLAGIFAFTLGQAPVLAAEQGLLKEPAAKADRTIMMYVCGSNIESDDANATAHRRLAKPLKTVSKASGFNLSLCWTKADAVGASGDIS